MQKNVQGPQELFETCKRYAALLDDMQAGRRPQRLTETLNARKELVRQLKKQSLLAALGQRLDEFERSEAE